jgi:hypothetical protein
MATAIILGDLNNITQDIYPIDYSLINITSPTRTTVASSILPFRVRFVPLQIESVRANVPAIPFQIIGYSNYIL